MLSRDHSLRSDTRKLSGAQGNVFGNPRAVLDAAQTPHQGMLHSWNQSVAGGNPARDSTGKRARSEERNQETIPIPRFARRPSTRNSLCPAEGGYPQNYMVDQQKLQISDQWSETTKHQRWQRVKMQHGELRTDRCPWFIDRLFELCYTYISSNVTAGLCSLVSTPHQQEVRVREGQYGHEPEETENPNKNDDNETVRRIPLRYLPEREKSSRRIFWMTVFQNTETHPVLLVNHLQSREQKWYRVCIVSLLTSRRTETATSA